MCRALLYLLSVLICSDSFTVYQIHPGSWGMAARRHSAPLTPDLRRYSTRPRPGARGVNPARAGGLATCLPSERDLLSNRDSLVTETFLSWAPEDAAAAARRPPRSSNATDVAAERVRMAWPQMETARLHISLIGNTLLAAEKSNPKTKLGLPGTSPYYYIPIF